MAFARHILLTFVVAATTLAQAPPVPSPLPGTTLLDTSTIAGPLELRAATADDEAVLAGLSYVRRRFSARPEILVPVFVSTYRDALFAEGWKLIDAPRSEELSALSGTVQISAHYLDNGKNLYTRITRTPDGAYEISVADVGAEDWVAAWSKQCRLTISSLHFDKDRPTLRLFESEPTLRKLADLLKRPNAPAIEIQGHADNIGEAGVAERQALSDARAKVVATWLASHGVAKSKLTTKGYGKLRPVATNDSDLGRALNRRIEIVRSGCSS